MEGQVQVGRTMIARVLSGHYTNTMCSVVWAPSQFSWTGDGHSDDVPVYESGRPVLKTVIQAAKQAVREGPNTYVSYYASYILPYWEVECIKKKRIGNHIFCDKRYALGDENLLVRDILLNLEAKDIPIPVRRPASGYSEIPEALMEF